MHLTLSIRIPRNWNFKDFSTNILRILKVFPQRRKIHRSRQSNLLSWILSWMIFLLLSNHFWRNFTQIHLDWVSRYQFVALLCRRRQMKWIQVNLQIKGEWERKNIRLDQEEVQPRIVYWVLLTSGNRGSDFPSWVLLIDSIPRVVVAPVLVVCSMISDISESKLDAP